MKSALYLIVKIAILSFNNRLIHLVFENDDSFSVADDDIFTSLIGRQGVAAQSEKQISSDPSLNLHK